MSLGSTCTSLRRASLSWFPEVTVEVVDNTDVASLAAWLERHQGEKLLLLLLAAFSSALSQSVLIMTGCAFSVTVCDTLLLMLCCPRCSLPAHQPNAGYFQ